MIKKLITALAALIITTSAALAVDYSGKTVTLWIPFKAGGGSDAWARAIGPAFSKNLPGNPTVVVKNVTCLLYTSPSPRDKRQSRMPSSA